MLGVTVFVGVGVLVAVTVGVFVGEGDVQSALVVHGVEPKVAVDVETGVRVPPT